MGESSVSGKLKTVESALSPTFNHTRGRPGARFEFDLWRIECLNACPLTLLIEQRGLLASRCKFGYTIYLCRLAFRPETL